MSNNNNKDNNKTIQKSKTTREPLYLASVYRYSCLGHVAVPSNKKDDRVCRGIQYGIQHAAESHRLISKEEATRDFSILNTTSKDRHAPGKPKAMSDVLQTQAIEMKNNSTEDDDDNRKSEKEWNEIDSYGITDVEVLVLQDSKTKKSQVAAVAPHCFVGSSVRNVGTHEGTTVSATIHLGPVEITVDSGVEEHEDNTVHASKPSHSQQEKNASPARHDSRREGTSVVKIGKKAVENMQKGASMLGDAVSEDFPSRMYDASQRVVGQMGKTVERTGKVVKSVYRVWFDGENDDGH